MWLSPGIPRISIVAAFWLAGCGELHDPKEQGALAESCRNLDGTCTSPMPQLDLSPDKEDAKVKDLNWHRCTIARIPWPSKSMNLPLIDQPYIVKAPPGWNNVLAQKLEKRALLDSMANVTCTPSQAGSKRIGNFEMTLAEYLTEWLPKPVSRNAEENRYVFGEFGDQWAPLRDAYVLLRCKSKLLLY